MEDLAAFSAREVKRAAAETERSISLQKDSKSRSKRESHPNELSQNSRKGNDRWGGIEKKEGQ